MPKYAWCHDGYEYHKEDQHGNEANTEAEAVACCIRMMRDAEEEPEAGHAIQIGEVLDGVTEMFVDVDDIIEDIRCKATDEGGECGEEWLDGFSKENKAELKEIICKFITEREPPNFYTIISTKEHKLTTEEIVNETEQEE